MRRKVGRKVISTVLSAALITSGIAFQSSDISAAKKVTKLTLNKKSATLYQGADKAYSSITLKATVKPSKAAKVKFTTSNKKIATVTAKGVVKAKKAGKVTITAKAGSKKAVCKVTVKKVSKKVKKVTVKKSKVTVYVGKTSKISATVTPAKATIKKVKYTTSNKKVATVTAKGVIKGVKAGTAKITVAAVDGSKKKTTVTVTVKKKAAKPSTAPTTEPSTAPSTAPTTEPSTAPSIAPTTEPSAKPATSPSISPSAEPATSPSISPSPSATPGNNGGGSSSSGDTTPVYSEVKAIDNGNGTVTYPLNTDKTYKVIYGSESAEITARDVETIMTYVKTYAGQANTYNTVASAYEKFNAKIKTAEGQSASLDNLDAGKVTVKLTGNDTYHITVAGKANTSANGEYDVKVTVLGDNVKVETTDSTNKTVTGTITSITAKKIVAKDIKVTKDTKVVDIASATVELSDPYVRVTVPKSDKLSNLKVYAK
ncbi:MAG: Ig domain-containing protein [Christensenellales bacterium]